LKKPQAKDYLAIAIPVVFVLNYLFSYLKENLVSEYTIVILVFIVLAEVAVVSLLTIKFSNNSNKYAIKKKNEKNSAKE
jgi:hypothetical protein